MVFHGNTCCIHNPEHTLIAQIPKHNGLYRLFTSRLAEGGFTRWVAEVLTIDELHRRLGHVGHDAVRILVKKGLVKGVELDLDSKPTFCMSCEWGTGHRKAVQIVMDRGFSQGYEG